MTGVTDALFEPDGDTFVPTALTTGPWDPGAQHGGAPAALLAGRIDRVDAPAAMSVARLTYELLRPVPLAPLRVTTSVIRPGRKVQLVQASLLTLDDTEVVRATALRIRTADLPVPDDTRPVDPVPPGHEHGTVLQFPTVRHDGPSFASAACDIRFVEGGFDRPGASVAWIRLTVPVVAGEPVSPLERVAAAADFGNGVSWVLPRERWVFINPDLTVHLVRPPVGEWVCLRSLTVPHDDGIGMAESALYDTEGRMGRSVQSLLLDSAG